MDSYVCNSGWLRLGGWASWLAGLAALVAGEQGWARLGVWTGWPAGLAALAAPYVYMCMYVYVCSNINKECPSSSLHEGEHEDNCFYTVFLAPHGNPGSCSDPSSCS